MNEVLFEWFKNEVISKLEKYEINYRYFPEGDFGSLDQISLESHIVGCEIDFWSSGVISIFIWNYQKEKQLFNEMFFSEDNESEKKKTLMKTFDILQNLVKK